MSFSKPSAGDTQERTYNTNAPIPEEFLVKAYKSWCKRGNESKHIPSNHLEAAKWWIDHQEPRWPQETPTVGYDSKGNQYWTTPYIDRVVAAWRKFLAMSEPEKAFVIDAIENRNTPYRGDDIKFYKLVIEEQARMDEMVAKGLKKEYIDNAFVQMRKAIKGMQMPKE